MKTVIRKILKESKDEWDWVRDTLDSTIDVTELEDGKNYKIWLGGDDVMTIGEKMNIFIRLKQLFPENFIKYLEIAIQDGVCYALYFDWENGSRRISQGSNETRDMNFDKEVGTELPIEALGLST